MSSGIVGSILITLVVPFLKKSALLLMDSERAVPLHAAVERLRGESRCAG